MSRIHFGASSPLPLPHGGGSTGSIPAGLDTVRFGSQPDRPPAHPKPGVFKQLWRWLRTRFKPYPRLHASRLDPNLQPLALQAQNLAQLLNGGIRRATLHPNPDPTGYRTYQVEFADGQTGTVIFKDFNAASRLFEVMRDDLRLKYQYVARFPHDEVYIQSKRGTEDSYRFHKDDCTKPLTPSERQLIGSIRVLGDWLESEILRKATR